MQSGRLSTGAGTLSSVQPTTEKLVITAHGPAVLLGSDAHWRRPIETYRTCRSGAWSSFRGRPS